MFERAFCEHFEQKAEVCIEMDTCVSTVDLAGDISRKTDRVKHRKAMDLTLAKLDCRLKHVITTYKAQLEQGGKYVADVTDNCDDVTGDPSKFDITFDLPDLVTCSGDADINNPIQPSKTDAAACSDWKNQEYTNPTDALPGENWVCMHSCVAPQTSSPTSTSASTMTTSTGAGGPISTSADWVYVRETKSYDESVTHCRGLGRDLLSLHSEEMVKDFANKRQCCDLDPTPGYLVRTGLRATAGCNWAWSDGTNFSPGDWFWTNGDPQDCHTASKAQCGYGYLYDNSITERPCDQRTYFICGPTRR